MGSLMETAAPARLSDAQRTALLEQFDRDGYIVLPDKLPAEWINRLLAAIDRVAAEKRAGKSAKTSVKVSNCVDADPAFRDLMMYEPALQLCYDLFGPMFHLCQS